MTPMNPMNDVGKWLREADPIAREPGLSASDVQSMRRMILAAADARSASPAWWPQPMLVAATVALTLALGAAVGQRLPERQSGDVSLIAHAAPNAGETTRRQLQFATPGGTRIIWVFNQEFEP